MVQRSTGRLGPLSIPIAWYFFVRFPHVCFLDNPGGALQVGSSNASHVIITQNTGIDINDGAINLYQATSNVNAVPFLISTDVGGTETEKVRVTGEGKVGIATDMTNQNVMLSIFG